MRAALLVALLAAAGAAASLPVGPGVCTEGYGPVAGALARPGLEQASFAFTACFPTVYLATLKTPLLGARWELASPLAAQACAWAPGTGGPPACEGPSPLPTVPGGPVTLRVVLDAGAGAFEFDSFDMA